MLILAVLGSGYHTVAPCLRPASQAWAAAIGMLVSFNQLAYEQYHTVLYHVAQHMLLHWQGFHVYVLCVICMCCVSGEGSLMDYSATKGAIASFTRALALQQAGKGKQHGGGVWGDACNASTGTGTIDCLLCCHMDLQEYGLCSCMLFPQVVFWLWQLQPLCTAHCQASYTVHCHLVTARGPAGGCNISFLAQGSPKYTRSLRGLPSVLLC